MEVSIDEVKAIMAFIVSQYRDTVSRGHLGEIFFHMALDNLQGIRLLLGHNRDVIELYEQFVLEVNAIRTAPAAPAVLAEVV